MAVVAATFLASCSINSDTIYKEFITSTEGSMVNVKFGSSDVSTRAFFDNCVSSDQRKVTYTLVFENYNGSPSTLTTHSYYRITDIINGLGDDAASTNITFTKSDWGSTNNFDVDV